MTIYAANLIERRVARERLWKNRSKIRSVLGCLIASKRLVFTRMVSDTITFAWLCDVFITESHQGQGLGKWLIGIMVSHPEMKEVKYILLATSDAYELYHKYGDFEAPRAIDKWMVRYNDAQ